jgi:predicted TIM-barrel fold metal-dependent hydrolase
MFAGPGWQMQHGENVLGDGTHLEEELRQYPPGTRTLADVEARLATMDELGVDIQIVHPTGWTHTVIDNPDEEIALARSYNRWMGEATAGSGGRLRWQIQPAMSSPDAVLEELDWGHAHGAVGVHLQGLAHGRVLTEKQFFPIWHRAEELDLVCVVHVGRDLRSSPQPANRRDIIWDVMAPVPGAFFHLMASDFQVRFPRLRWAFVEAGTMWAPWLIQQFSRAGSDLWRDLRSDWTQDSTELLAERNLWISAEQDDDMAFVVEHLGDTNLIVGSGWGHFDMATDPDVHRRIADHPALDITTRARLTSENARELFRLPAATFARSFDS